MRVNDLPKTSIPLILIWVLVAGLDHGGVKVVLVESFFFVVLSICRVRQNLRGDEPVDERLAPAREEAGA